MYIAKRDGKGGYRALRAGHARPVVERLELRADLQLALEHEQFELLLPAGRAPRTAATITGVEALVRWHHPTRGLIPPERVHPAGRGDGPDRPDRPLGARRGAAAQAVELQRRFRARAPLTIERQPLGQAAAAPRRSSTTCATRSSSPASSPSASCSRSPRA